MKRTIACAAAVLLLFLSAAGCAVVAPNVPVWGGSFGAMEDDGYINVFEGKSNTHAGVTLRVEAVACDGLTTYVRIAAEGALPPGLAADVAPGGEMPSFMEEYNELSDIGVYAFEAPGKATIGSNHILEAVLSDGGSGAWPFKHQAQLGFTGEPFYVIRPTLDDPGLEPNEDVLIFYNTELSGAATLSLAVEIRGIAEKFVINDLAIRAAPIVTRDFSAYDLVYQTAFADLRLLSARSTYLETIFTIQWTLRPGFSHAHPFFQDQLITFDWGEDSDGTFMFYPDDANLGDAPVEIVSSHTVAGPVPLEQEIAVRAMRMQSREIAGTLFVIPAAKLIND